MEQLPVVPESFTWELTSELAPSQSPSCSSVQQIYPHGHYRRVAPSAECRCGDIIWYPQRVCATCSAPHEWADEGITESDQPDPPLESQKVKPLPFEATNLERAEASPHETAESLPQPCPADPASRPQPPPANGASSPTRMEDPARTTSPFYAAVPRTVAPRRCVCGADEDFGSCIVAEQVVSEEPATIISYFADDFRVKDKYNPLYFGDSPDDIAKEEERLRQLREAAAREKAAVEEARRRLREEEQLARQRLEAEKRREAQRERASQSPPKQVKMDVDGATRDEQSVSKSEKQRYVRIIEYQPLYFGDELPRRPLTPDGSEYLCGCGDSGEALLSTGVGVAAAGLATGLAVGFGALCAASLSVLTFSSFSEGTKHVPACRQSRRHRPPSDSLPPCPHQENHYYS